MKYLRFTYGSLLNSSVCRGLVFDRSDIDSYFLPAELYKTFNKSMYAFMSNETDSICYLVNFKDSNDITVYANVPEDEMYKYRLLVVPSTNKITFGPKSAKLEVTKKRITLSDNIPKDLTKIKELMSGLLNTLVLSGYHYLAD